MLLLSALTIVSFTGCGTLFGLRPDFDDGSAYENEPTTGGAYSEAGYLDEERSNRNPAYANPGHSDNESNGAMGGRGSWLGDDSALRGRQAQTRMSEEGVVSYSTAPNMNVPSKRGYKNGGGRATKEDFIDDAKVDGSLWTSDGQTNYFLTKNRIRTVGDILAVVANEEFVKDVAFELKKSLNPDEREAEIAIAQERLRRKANGLPEDDTVASSASSSARAPAAINADGSEPEKKEVDVPRASWADVDLKKSIEFKAGDQCMAEVVDRYPNGNYKVRGVKKIRLRNGYRMINFVAIAKNSDISEEDKIDAGKLYEYRIEALR